VNSDGWYRWDGDALLLWLQVQPRAHRNEFVAPHGDHFKLRITAPPVEGKANAHLLRFLAKEFGVNRSQVSLESGKSARYKVVRIESPKRRPVQEIRYFS
jgi:uncharacterized protein (TIGR00251 family)